MNNRIRTAIINYLNANGKQDTRYITDIFSKQFHTSKQRIAGNLRAMKYDFKNVSIVTYNPGIYSEIM